MANLRRQTKPVSGPVATLLCVVTFLVSCSTTPHAPVINRGTSDNRAPPTVSKHTPPSAYDPAAATRGYHVVVTGDTLYSIAWRYGFDYRNLAQWNDIAPPYVIYPKQVIRLHSRTAPASERGHRGPAEHGKKTAAHGIVINRSPDAPARNPPNNAAISWQWPTSGRIVTSDSPTSKKGIDISGKMGQSITAAAAGEVVYSGSGLLGYGKLIIIKHNDTFLSAYAHNEKILVKEGDKVSTGDKIATMGVGSNGKPLLHFEIRQDGRPVSPLDHLPKQHS